MTDALLPALLDPPAERPALAFPDGALTYPELATRAGALAQQIAGLKRVAVRATPTLDTAVGIVAALLAGVPAVPINPRSGPRELAHVVADAAPDAVLAAAAADADLLPPLAALPRFPIPRESARSTARNPDLDMPPSAPALVIYTSGTTGPPKGAVLSRVALAANLDALADAWAWTAADVLVHALPLFHVHGLVLGVLGPLRRGGSMRHLGTFSASSLARAVEDGATLVFGVPTHYHRLVDELAADPAAAAAVGRARLLVSGSAALTAVDHARLQRLTGLAVRERYGLTETLILTAARADEPVEPGTVGRPLADTEIRLVREDAGDDLGAVEVRGPGLFSGYLGGSDPTTQDGWFRTGDIGRWTASGSLALVGRKTTDLIKSGGFKIGAGEIENALLEHPAVAEVAVLGVPDDDLGERVVAFVVTSDRTDAGALVDHVAGLLAPHKRPREVRFVDALPRNDMGKVVKSRLLR
ncbi:AMP-binding protein [Pseudonocardia charpentierae]|uniref:AMP-binding protein n=1 Tax=Pseudonocardia charpentierae TaxID=3075545 RepID=A0ABU2NI23_9PSEU|nr:AMP-binding protein [Pseudonocardia sp. DSM 45834]MDT0353350.1 AMP-binding protein [Pseudonocardia sp. DSM 45834]